MKRYTEQEDQFIRDNYGKLTYEMMARHLDAPNRHSVKNRARKLGIEFVGQGVSEFSRKQRTYHVQDDFFSDLTPTACYWAGYLAADGTVHSRGSGVTLKVSSKDRDQLEVFKEQIGFDGPIHDRIEKGFPVSSITFTSKQIVADLKAHFNVCSVKTFNLPPPNLSDPLLVKSFLCGYLDGDGSVGFAKTKTTVEHRAPYVSAVGASKEFYDWLDQVMQQFIGVEKSLVYQRGRKCHFIVWRWDALKLAEHMLTLPVPMLERKWGKLRDLPKERKKGWTAAGVRKRKGVVKITPEQRQKIEELILAGELKNTEIGTIYGVTGARIGQIKKALLEGYLKESEDYVDAEEVA